MRIESSQMPGKGFSLETLLSPHFLLLLSVCIGKKQNVGYWRWNKLDVLFGKKTKDLRTNKILDLIGTHHSAIHLLRKPTNDIILLSIKLKC